MSAGVYLGVWTSLTRQTMSQGLFYTLKQRTGDQSLPTYEKIIIILIVKQTTNSLALWVRWGRSLSPSRNKNRRQAKVKLWFTCPALAVSNSLLAANDRRPWAVHH